MGEFDDVLAMEPGDEWDAPDHRLEDEQPPLPDTVVELRVPGAIVQLRGQVPPEVVSGLSALRYDPAEEPGDESDERSILAGDGRTGTSRVAFGLGDEPITVPVVVRRSDTGWTVEGPSGLRDMVASSEEALLRTLVGELDSILLHTDSGRLHLEVSCVEIAGRGIVLVSDDVQYRRSVTAALLEQSPPWGVAERGSAALVTDRILTILPGSHTVFGYPAPTDSRTARPSEMPAILPFTTVDVIAFVGRSPSSQPGLVRSLPMPEACIRMLDVAIDRERFGPAALDAMASTVSNASNREIVHEDPRDTATAVLAVDPAPRREFCVVHRFEAEPSPEDAELGRASLRVARFDDGAVALDARTRRLLVLTPDETDALEGLLVTETADDDPDRSSRLERLAEHGMHVPDSRPARPVPGPEAFGLPNCPSGDTARQMWAERRRLGGDEEVEQVDGSTALAVLRGALPVDEQQQRAAVEVHRRLQDEVVGVERQLLATIDALQTVDISPLVLGSVVHAHDGLLPPYFAESEQADLLVRDGELPRAIRALLDAGHTWAPIQVHDSDAAGVVDLIAPDGATRVRLRDTLAVGPFGALVDHEEFHRRAVPIRIHGRWCRSLHPEHRFVHACVQVEVDEHAPSTQHVRDVVLSAPRADALMAEAMEASERWGATATVTAAVRKVDEMVPGLPPWIVERSTRPDAIPEEERRRGRGRRAWAGRAHRR